MATRLLRVVVLCWIFLMLVSLLTVLVLAYRDPDRMLGITFAMGGAGIFTVLAILPSFLMPVTLPGGLEKVASGDNSVVCENHWMWRSCLLSVGLCAPAGIGAYFNENMRLNRGDLYQTFISIVALSTMAGLILMAYHYRPLIWRYTFLGYRVIVDCGDMRRYCIVVKFEGIRFEERWNGTTVHFDGCTAESRIVRLLGSGVKVVDSRKNVVKLPGSQNVTQGWRPVLSHESMEKVQAFYARE